MKKGIFFLLVVILPIISGTSAISTQYDYQIDENTYTIYVRANSGVIDVDLIYNKAIYSMLFDLETQRFYYSFFLGEVSEGMKLTILLYTEDSVIQDSYIISLSRKSFQSNLDIPIDPTVLFFFIPSLIFTIFVIHNYIFQFQSILILIKRRTGVS